MKVLGIVAEYNPFHNGHLYHLEQSKEISSSSHVVCVMSGNFIQRGEPAIVNKRARTEMALLSGIDLVLELPVAYAMASAEFFAYGAVKILDSLGVTDNLCFGSESGNVHQLREIAEILVREPDSFKDYLKAALNNGLSYAAAREIALTRFLQSKNESPDRVSSLMGSSNNILGIEYLKALIRLESPIIPLTVMRIGNSYNTEQITGSISSATAVRKLISSAAGNTGEVLAQVLPKTSLEILKREFLLQKGPVFSDSFEDIILADLRRKSPEALRQLPYISEGIENRLKEAAEKAGTLDELLNRIITKRYPKTRIQRTLVNLLSGITAEEFDRFNKFGGPQYIRVLGFNEKGRQLLSQINKKATLPVIIKTADFKRSCNPLLRRMLEIECTATDIYVLGYKNTQYRKAGQEFTESIVRITS